MKPHKKLEVWQRSFDLARDLYLVTNSFPADERFGMISQIRRAATSIPVNIAEGAARSSGKQFVWFLYVAAGSASELDTLLLLSQTLGLGKREELEILLSKLEDISKMLFGLIKSVSEQRVNR